MKICSFTLGMFAVILYLPMYLQVLTGVSATHSGSLLTPMMLSVMLAALVSDQLISCLHHYKGFAVFGLAVVTAGMYYLGRLPVDATHAMVVTGMIITGIGMGVAVPTFMVAVQNTVLVAAINRAVQPKSKVQIADWYAKTMLDRSGLFPNACCPASVCGITWVYLRVLHWIWIDRLELTGK